MHVLVPVLALLLVALVVSLRALPAFRISLRGGQVTVERGHPPASFVAAVRDICRDLDVASGSIRGVGTGRNVQLRFSFSVPSRCRQRLRNAWGVHR